MLLTEIGSAVKNREMPVQQYVLLHSEARLPDQDRERIYEWTRAERKRLKSAPLPSGADRPQPERLSVRESKPGMLVKSNVRVGLAWRGDKPLLYSQSLLTTYSVTEISTFDPLNDAGSNNKALTDFSFQLAPALARRSQPVR